ncbi:MAG: HDIG domain-containing protein [Rhabdochlamydiaceae bacterium]|nr:HDIG domain-containing protein [Rhabdochlamydiaceae bacterium]
MILKMIHRLLASIKNLTNNDWKWVYKSLFVTCFILTLAYFLHFREVRVDRLEMGSVAKKYVLAQVSFDFPDIETTRMLREESLKDIGLIYYFDDEEIMKAKDQIEDELIHNPQWREQFPSLTFDDLMKANDAIRDALIKLEFTDARTVEKLALLQVNSLKFLSCEGDGKEGLSMECVWEQVQKAAFPDSMGEASQFMLHKYRSYRWHFEQDFDLRHKLRKYIKEHLPTRMTHVEAGSRIINAGDEVTRRHLNMLQEMKKVLTEEQNSLKPLTVLGSVFFSIILVSVCLVYFYKFHLSIIESFSKLSLIAVVTILTLCFAKLSEYFISQQSFFVDACRLPVYLLFASVTLSVLIDRTIALFISGLITILLNITLATSYPDFVIMNLTTAVLGIVWTKGVRKRKEIFTICSKVWLSSIPMIFALYFLKNQFWSRQILNDCVTTSFFIFAISMLIVAFLPFLESTFGIVTDMILLESGDSNNPLLRRLNLEAPGTYQHSLSVANLAENAALAIGANALLCRVSGLYHDIGKVIQPSYFTENLGDGFNMHQLLTPVESAQVIIQHVTEGIKLAENANLPKPIIDVIREHHGTTLVYYFYHAHIEQNRSRSLGLEEGFFRYPGPTPQSREAAIVMIADSIEATFRCERVTDEKSITALIEGIVGDKIKEHQLDASGLTFDDLEAVKKAIFRSLLAIVHVRPNYPIKPKSISQNKAFV